MTREDVINILVKRVDGYSLEEIAKEFGVTRERIRQIIGSATTGTVNKRSSGCKCIYTGLKNWFFAKGFSAYQMNKELGLFKNTTGMYSRLTGTRKLDIDEIKAILKYTGLTFEEAFGEVEE